MKPVWIGNVVSESTNIASHKHLVPTDMSKKYETTRVLMTFTRLLRIKYDVERYQANSFVFAGSVSSGP